MTEPPTHGGQPHLRWYDIGNLHKVALEAPAFEDQYMTPLVADYSGAMINVSFKSVDAAAWPADFYPPVFDDVDTASRNRCPTTARRSPRLCQATRWSCNCILNDLYGELEGQRTGPIAGPMTSARSPSCCSTRPWST